MGWNDFIRIDHVPLASEARETEVDQLLKEGLAAQIQEKLRSRLDPGIDLRGAQAAQAVRSHADGGRIVIDQKGQDEVLAAADPGRRVRAGSQVNVTDLDDLFVLSSGVPEIEVGADGSRRMVFRRVSQASVQGKAPPGSALSQDEQDHIVDQVATEVFSLGVPEAHERATQEVNDTYIGENLMSKLTR